MDQNPYEAPKEAGTIRADTRNVPQRSARWNRVILIALGVSFLILATVAFVTWFVYPG
jgi:hypothetical protein